MSDLRRLLHLCRPFRWRIAFGVVLSVTVMLSNVALMAVSGWFITSMALAGLGRLTLEFFTPAAAIRGLALLRAGARYLERLVTHEATLALIAKLRPWLYTRLVPLAPAGLRGLRHGDLLARLRGDVDALENVHLRLLGPVLSALVAGGAVVLWLGLVWWPLALWVALGLCVAGGLVPLIQRAFLRQSGGRITRARARLQAESADLTRGLAELQVFGAVERQVLLVQACAARMVAAQRRQAWLGAVFTALGSLVGQGMVLGALVLLIPQVSSQTLSGPEMAMLVLAVMAAMETVAGLPAAVAHWDSTMASARRIFELADQPPEVLETSHPRPPRAPELVLDHVSFAYPGGPEVIRGLSLRLVPGQSLALTGPSGAGKTTVLHLVQRFWDPSEGAILLSGVDLRALSDADLRGGIAVVDQHVHLFNGTIAENLRLAQPGASDEALWNALDLAALRAEVAAMPQGLATRLGELGARLSGGQARRLAVARAALQEAPLLLLDEPTEGLDRATQAQVIAGLRQLGAGRMMLIVTHHPQVLALAQKKIMLNPTAACTPLPASL
ncbi:thiol reductant ABC exporter subunit CydC [Thioclava sp. GXIMD4216]|uniref:thiol reductant ABC exporter subunit CydC n=1 Tax=Thioclava sp. GXIMD4216 TaxID=3131929 RepID=UPI0030CBAE61